MESGEEVVEFVGVDEGFGVTFDAGLEFARVQEVAKIYVEETA